MARSLRNLVRRAKDFEKPNIITVPNEIWHSQELQTQAFFADTFPLQSEISAKMQTLARGPEGTSVAVDVFTNADKAVTGELGATEMALVADGVVDAWVKSLIEPPSGEEPTQWRAVLWRGSILLYNLEEPTVVYAFMSSEDENCVVDPAAVFERDKPAYVKALQKATRFDGKPFVKRDAAAIAASPRHCGWREEGRDIHFDRDMTKLLSVKVPTTKTDGMPNEPLHLVAARVRELSTPVLVGEDTAVTDGCALHEKMVVMFGGVTQLEMGAPVIAHKNAKPEPATPPQPTRIVKLIPLSRGDELYSGVVGGERVLQLLTGVSLNALASSLQDALRMEALRHMARNLQTTHNVPEDNLTEEHTTLIAEHTKNIDFFYVVGMRLQNTAAWKYASNTMVVDVIRASALVSARALTNTGAQALLGAQYDAKQDALQEIQTQNYWRGANVSVLDCIAALPADDTSDPDTIVFQGVAKELRTRPHVRACVRLLRKRVDSNSVASFISENSQLMQLINKHTSFLVALCMGNIHATLWDTANNGNLTQMESTNYMLLAVQRALATEAYRQETGLLIPPDNVEEYVSDVVKKLGALDQPVQPQHRVATPWQGAKDGLVYTTREHVTDYYPETV